MSWYRLLFIHSYLYYYYLYYPILTGHNNNNNNNTITARPIYDYLSGFLSNNQWTSISRSAPQTSYWWTCSLMLLSNNINCSFFLPNNIYDFRAQHEIDTQISFLNNRPRSSLPINNCRLNSEGCNEIQIEAIVPDI